MDDAKRAVLEDALREEGVEDVAMFITALKHWRSWLSEELARRVTNYLRDGYCEECSSASWKRTPSTLGLAEGPFRESNSLAWRDGTFLIHSPRCRFGNFALDAHPLLRDLTVEVCWAEALLEDKERAAAIAQGIRAPHPSDGDRPSRAGTVLGGLLHDTLHPWRLF